MTIDDSPLLQGVSIAKYFGRRDARHQVLHDVDVDIRAGECLAIIGGSGSGKSTLVRILLGLERADAGEVLFEGDPVRRGSGFAQALGSKNAWAVNKDEMRRDRLRAADALRKASGLVWQNPFASLDPRWTAGRSVAEPLRIQRRDLDRAQVHAHVYEALRTVGLQPEEFAGRYPIDLSGGQAQRVAIARAIVNEPKLLVADEPMSAIDVAARVQILEAFAAIRRARPHAALVIVSHDLGVVQHIADRILVLHDGRVVELGPMRDVLDRPADEYTKRLIAAASM